MHRTGSQKGAGFVVAMRVDSESRHRWADAGIIYVRKAGELYGWSWRQLFLVAPIHVAVLLVAIVFFGFDRFVSP